ncbi:poly(3-hydroxyalkanoate) depolymerase [Phreatobacter stygius]|uniref:Poly(3-hydroxyalkanoate) depolymerase n=2 Tax=Phreatobacter stygius TaxID=1940610 RepID=A0A4D7BMM3_9HYPH|nr:poly(3-hydroxyalkanoate) depolymerase [Phreatobacter stygius]
MIDVGGQILRVGIKAGRKDKPALLMFNGIGANLELAEPFFQALTDTEAVIFDIPGIGGSPAPLLPYRPSTLAKLAHDLIVQLGYDQVDVSGVSWGGGLAQQFAFQFPETCRKLVLVSTSAGMVMLPGAPNVLLKMASPKRYTDRGYMKSIAAEIYGGAFRRDPHLIDRHAAAMRGSTQYGYALQLIGMLGWTSVPWLWMLQQPTLILSGTDDPLIPVINAQLLATLIPKARLELIDDGHLFVVTDPQRSAKMVEAFLDEP